MESAVRRRLGEILVERGFVSPEQLREALRVQYQVGKRLGEILLEAKAVSPEELGWALAEALGIAYVELRAEMVDLELVRTLPEDVLRRHETLPLLRTGDELTVVLADPTDQQAVAELETLTGARVVTAIASREVIVQLLDKAFPSGRARPGRVREARPLALGSADGGEPAAVAQAYALLLGALREDASEVHLEPLARDVRVRYRLPDGQLAERARLPRPLLGPLTSRLRTVAGLPGGPGPAEASLCTHLEGRDVELELLFFPTLHGEAVTVKVWRRWLEAPALESLELDAGVLAALRQLATGPGLVLVTGWDRRGRAALLYALARHAAPARKVVTLERTASFTVPEFLQVEVPGDFAANAARILAYPTDVVLVDELAAEVTCRAALRSAEQGALVLGGLAAATPGAGVAHLVGLPLPREAVLAALRGAAHVRLHGSRHGVDVLPMTDRLRQDWLATPPSAWTSPIS